MTLEIIIAVLLLFILAREYIIWKEVQKLTDKIISRDYTEYMTNQVDLETAKKTQPKPLDNYMRV